MFYKLQQNIILLPKSAKLMGSLVIFIYFNTF